MLDAQKTQVYFHQRARQFDSLYAEKRDLAYIFNHTFRSAICKRVELTVREFNGLSNFSVLDVGCGSGRNSVIFAKTGAQRVLGVDFADNMIDLARRYRDEHKVDNTCEFIKQDVMAWSTDEKFDVVVALGVFDYIQDPRALLTRMAHFSKGKVIASFPGLSLVRAPLRKLRYSLRNCAVYFFSRTELQKAARDAGLEDISIHSSSSSGWMLIGRVRQ